MKAQRSSHDNVPTPQSFTRYNFTALGMLLGVAIAGGLGVILFNLTGQAFYIAITGVGAGIGLSLGAGIDQQRQSS